MRRLVVEADGGSRGNPGVAGYGALVREGSRVLRELAAPLGRESNNVAEYTGLIVGLRTAHEIAGGEPVGIHVRMDSKLVVEQMSGRWKIKHADMQRLAAEARQIVRAIEAEGGSVDFAWIPRAENKAADALSNEGMDGHHVDRVPGGAPGGADADAEVGDPVAPPPGWREGLGAGRTAAAADGEAADPRDGGAGIEPGRGEVSSPPPPPTDPALPEGDPAATSATTSAITPATTPAITPASSSASPTAPEAGTRTAAAPASSSAPDLSPPVRIVLVRHGVTEYTREGRLDGRGGADPALTAEGTAQARAAARGVEAFLGRGGEVRVVTSSLQRARQTGSIIAAGLGVPAEVEPDLDELCFGEWEGRTVADVTRADPGALQRSRTAEDVPPPGGESYADLAARVLPAVRRLVEESRARVSDRAGDGGDAPAVPPALVLVTHRGPIGVILADVLGMERPNVWRLATGPCSLTSIRAWRDGGVVVEFVNDTSHLR